MNKNNYNSLALYGLAFLISIIPLFLTPYLNLVDYYRHVIRYFIIAMDVTGGQFPDGYSVHFNWQPNIGGDIASIPFFILFEPQFAAKLFVIFVFVLLLSGVMIVRHVERAGFGLFAFLVGCLFLYNHIFHWGFINFLFGFAVGLWALAYWIWAKQKSLILALVGGALIGTFVYICHGLAFIIYGLMIASYEIGKAVEAGGLKKIHINKGLIKTLVLTALTAIPAVLIFLWTGFKGNPAKEGTLDKIISHLSTGTLQTRMSEVLYDRTFIIFRQLETEYFYYDIVFNSILIAGLIYALRKGLISIPTRWLVVFGVFGLLYIISPPMFLGVGYVPDRIPTLLIFLFAAIARFQKPEALRPIMIFVCVMLLARTLSLGAIWYGNAEKVRGPEQWVQYIKPGDVILEAFPANRILNEDFGQRCNIWAAPYVWLSQAYAFTFTAKGVQPLQLEGRAGHIFYRDTLRTPRPRQASGYKQYNDDRIKLAAKSTADYVITCHEHLFMTPPSAYMDLVATNGTFSLYKPRKPESQ